MRDPNRHAPRRAVIFASFALLTLIWGTTFAAVRVGLVGMPPFTGLALRFVLASAVLLAAGRMCKVRFGATARERKLWAAVAFLSFCVSYAGVYWGEQWVPSGLAAVLFATFPLFVALLGHFALRSERLGPAKLVGVLLGFLGVALIFSEDFAALGGRQVAIASAVMLISPLASSFSLVAVKRWGHDVHPLSLSAVPMGLAAGVMGGLALAFERDRQVSFDAVSVSIVVYLALIGSAVTFSLYYWLLRHVTAGAVSLISLLTPIVAVVVGAIFLGEPTTARMLAGSLLVVGGVALSARAPRRSRDAGQPTVANAATTG